MVSIIIKSLLMNHYDMFKERKLLSLKMKFNLLKFILIKYNWNIYWIGSNFNIMNYVNENEFVSWIKSGGYGKVYKGTFILKF